MICCFMSLYFRSFDISIMQIVMGQELIAFFFFEDIEQKISFFYLQKTFDLSS